MRTRRLGVITTLALTASVLVVVPRAGPASAAADCLSEPPAGLLQPGCDDTVPPETSLTAVSTPPNAGGWVATSTMGFAFTGAHTDADTGALGFECKLDGPTRAHDWTACTSPRTYEGLVDSEAAYAFPGPRGRHRRPGVHLPCLRGRRGAGRRLRRLARGAHVGPGHRRAGVVRQPRPVRRTDTAAAGRDRSQRRDPPEQQRARRRLRVRGRR
ncbi:hypothetical protein [Nocardioides sp. B-3]|uniref:hypothetical protein n=1 Tax=Nocardioides sp. B-3 TaxID=2895565 RepID=UPI002153A1FB|nr:hypothetical protein [Nocardioides sp. B-3]UUZ61123.1 hypothetical protein LP418_11095 [Nocardioides sp. B-3]